MNHATPKMKNNDLTTPVSATAMGAGRVRALRVCDGRLGCLARQPVVRAAARGAHHLDDTLVHGGEPRIAAARLHRGLGRPVRGLRSRHRGHEPSRSTVDLRRLASNFSLAAGASQRVRLRLTVDPSVVSRAGAGVRPVLLPPERGRRGDGPRDGRKERPAPRPVARRPAGGERRTAVEVVARPDRRRRHRPSQRGQRRRRRQLGGSVSARSRRRPGQPGRGGRRRDRRALVHGPDDRRGR